MKRLLTVMVALIVLLTSTALATAYPFPDGELIGHTSVDKKVIKCDYWVSLRAEPDTSAERIAEVPLGAIVTSYEDFGDFTYCEYEGQEGYILSEYLRELTAMEEVGYNEATSYCWNPASSSGIVNIIDDSDAVQELRMTINGSATTAEVLSDEAKLFAIASGIVPTDVDFTAYKINLMLGIEIIDAEIADLAVTFPIVPAYAPDVVLMAIVAIVENGVATYTVCSCEMNDDNCLDVVIPAATVDAIQNGPGDTVMMFAVR